MYSSEYATIASEDSHGRKTAGSVPPERTRSSARPCPTTERTTGSPVADQLDCLIPGGQVLQTFWGRLLIRSRSGSFHQGESMIPPATPFAMLLTTDEDGTTGLFSVVTKGR